MSRARASAARRRAHGGPSRPVLPSFESVVADHGPAVLRFCAAQVGPDRAEDCFQEAMLAALRGYDQLRDPAAIRPWLFSIAARKAIDAHRARGRAPDPTDEVDEVALGDGPPEPEDGLWAEVRALPTKQSQAVTLRYRADLTHAEVAEVMEISEAAARRNVFEGLRRLRRNR